MSPMARSLQGIPYFSSESRGCAEHQPDQNTQQMI
jgi:hypothetical protein